MRASRKRAVQSDVMLAHEALARIEKLFDLANKGNEDAATLVARILKRSVTKLTALAHINPSIFRRAARKSARWPVMMSRHPRLCDNHKAMFGSLNLGYDLHVYFDERSKWTIDSFGRIASTLLYLVRRDRDQNRVALPEFKKGEKAEQWWTHAEKLFLDTHPNPENKTQFAQAISLKRRTPGRVRELILRRIKQRFIAFAKP